MTLNNALDDRCAALEIGHGTILQEDPTETVHAPRGRPAVVRNAVAEGVEFADRILQITVLFFKRTLIFLALGDIADWR